MFRNRRSGSRRRGNVGSGSRGFALFTQLSARLSGLPHAAHLGCSFSFSSLKPFCKGRGRIAFGKRLPVNRREHCPLDVSLFAHRLRISCGFLEVAVRLLPRFRHSRLFHPFGSLRRAMRHFCKHGFRIGEILSVGSASAWAPADFLLKVLLCLNRISRHCHRGDGFDLGEDRRLHQRLCGSSCGSRNFRCGSRYF